MAFLNGIPVRSRPQPLKPRLTRAARAPAPSYRAPTSRSRACRPSARPARACSPARDGRARDAASGLPSTKPWPLSVTRSSTVGADASQRDRHRSALAWRPALATASCAMRNRSPAISGGSSTRLDCRPSPRSRSGASRWHAVLDRGGEAQLLERVGAEVDDLVAQRLDVPRRRARAPPRSGRAAFVGLPRRPPPGRPPRGSCRALSAPVRGRRGWLRHPPPHLALRLDGAAREAARAHPRRRLGGAQPADHAARWRGRTSTKTARRRRAASPLTGSSPRTAPGITRQGRPEAATAMPRRSPWKWAWTATRNSAAKRTAP